ncbi:TetR/AcrR family transcriptional regulator [Micromonospora krabiensis]|uniref:Transcriptional regulator, TetR family n=1 Tax=Micromonospora krabiensis TaxID=307121 RepID=A0A1C3NE10_9ACTN|nr:TetR/AcrR family transcriptional regulator [Micromonospora krabiensis]SBV30827.1 transcriptional regulator, TetR family [Micromonospora krabiensis]
MRAPRRDQLRNRQRLVTAAREAFAEHGPEVALEEIARRAGVGTTTLYRHFPEKEGLIEAVLDDLAAAVRHNAELAMGHEDPVGVFRAVFTQSCDMSEQEVATFARLAGAGDRADDHAQRLITSVVGPATDRLRAAGRLRAGITAEDIATFVRMTLTADSDEARSKAIQVMLDGLVVEGGASEMG